VKAIETRRITKRFGREFLLSPLDLHVEAGEFLALVGPNGVGKTTLLRLLAGLTEPSSGEAWVLGCPVGQLKQASHLVGMVHQSSPMAEYLSVREYLEGEALLRGLGRDAVEEALTVASLGGVASSRMGSLSIGTRRRASIARALLHRPRVLLLDEPTAGLDPLVRRGIWEDLRARKRKDLAGILATHDMEEAESLCDAALLMRKTDGVVETSLVDLRRRRLEAGAIQVLVPEPDGDSVARAMARLREGPWEVADAVDGNGLLEICTPGDPHLALPSVIAELVACGVRFSGVWVQGARLEGLIQEYCGEQCARR
jgi:ABC-type multidrug transport system ATPase subunit